MTQRALVAPMGALWTMKADAHAGTTAYDSRQKAIDAARSLLAATGGGELVVRGTDGQVDLTESVARSSAPGTALTAARTPR